MKRVCYLFVPRNPNLFHCPQSYYSALEKSFSLCDSVEYLKPNSIRDHLRILLLFFRQEKSSNFAVFFYAIQFEYLFMALLIKIFLFFKIRKIHLIYLMHEPFIEFGRISFFKTCSIYIFNKLFAYLSSQVILPSEIAVDRAKKIVHPDKIFKINLTFESVSRQNLESNLKQLEATWDTSKTFSFIGTFRNLENNPEGFISFMNSATSTYAEKVRFIRAGKDLVDVGYSGEIIRFPGYVSQNAKQFLMGLTHFLIIPYSNITQSGTVVEALSYGKLLILNDISSFSHFRDLEFISMLDFSNKDSIAESLRSIHGMSFREYERYYWSTIEYFESNYSPSYLINRLAKVFSLLDF